MKLKFLSCIQAKSNIAKKCFIGGDQGHIEQISDLYRAYGKCSGHQW